MSNEEILRSITELGQEHPYGLHQVVEAIRLARIDTIEQCAELAQVSANWDSDGNMLVCTGKQSILSLIDEL